MLAYCSAFSPPTPRAQSPDPGQDPERFSQPSQLTATLHKQASSFVRPSVRLSVPHPSLCLFVSNSKSYVRARATVPPRRRAVPVRGRWWTERNGMVVWWCGRSWSWWPVVGAAVHAWTDGVTVGAGKRGGARRTGGVRLGGRRSDSDEVSVPAVRYAIRGGAAPARSGTGREEHGRAPEQQQSYSVRGGIGEWTLLKKSGCSLNNNIGRGV